jgi:hypothetical protein
MTRKDVCLVCVDEYYGRVRRRFGERRLSLKKSPTFVVDHENEAKALVKDNRCPFSFRCGIESGVPVGMIMGMKVKGCDYLLELTVAEP